MRKPANPSAARKLRERFDLYVERALDLLRSGDVERARTLLLEVVHDEAITDVEAARLIGVSRRTLQQYRQEGHGPAWFKVGPRKKKGGVRYARLDVLEYREQQKTTCTSRVLKRE